MGNIAPRFLIPSLLICTSVGLSFGFGAGVALSDNPHKLEIKTKDGSVTLETSIYKFNQGRAF